MKHCPACRSLYTDDTLSFCLQDGTPLENDAMQSTIDTVAFSNPVTVDRIFNTEQLRSDRRADTPRTQAWREQPRSVLRNPPQKKRSNKLSWAAIVGVPLLLLFVAAGVGGWMYFENRTRHTATDVAKQTEPDTAANPPIADSIKAERISDAKPTEAEPAKQEFADTLEAWKRAAESRDANAYAGMYAPKADYLGNPDATPIFIRSEAQKTFELYSEIEIELSAVKIAMDEQGTTATAIFDKEWSYMGKEKLQDGKAHFKVHLQKIDGSWKTTGEKSLKVYFNEG